MEIVGFIFLGLFLTFLSVLFLVALKEDLKNARMKKEQNDRLIKNMAENNLLIADLCERVSKIEEAVL